MIRSLLPDGNFKSHTRIHFGIVLYLYMARYVSVYVSMSVFFIYTAL